MWVRQIASAPAWVDAIAGQSLFAGTGVLRVRSQFVGDEVYRVWDVLDDAAVAPTAASLPVVLWWNEWAAYTEPHGIDLVSRRIDPADFTAHMPRSAARNL